MLIAGMNKITFCTYFFQPFEILTLPSLCVYEMVTLYKYLSTLIKTGRDLRQVCHSCASAKRWATNGKICSKKYKIIQI